MSTIVFSGSGSLYPIHLGAASALFKAGVVPTTFVGTSGGAIVASVLASGISPEEGLELCKITTPKDIISFNWRMLERDHWGLFSLHKIEKILDKYIPKKMCDVKIPVYIVTTDVGRGEAHVFSSIETPIFKLSKAVRISASIPFLFESTPYKQSEALLVDGGVVKHLATDLDVVKDSSSVYAIRILSNSAGKNNKPTNLKEFVVRVLESMLSEIERKHIEDAEMFGKVITLTTDLNSLDFFTITPDKIQYMYDLGYEQMSKKIESGKVKV